MIKAYNNGIDRVWIANVGDIKAKAMRDFGLEETKAEKFACIDIEDQRLVFSKKPEHFYRNFFNRKNNPTIRAESEKQMATALFKLKAFMMKPKSILRNTTVL